MVTYLSPKDHKKGLKCRVISFPGEFQPIMRTCRAPLGDGGKLCPRSDRRKVRWVGYGRHIYVIIDSRVKGLETPFVRFGTNYSI